MYIQTTGFPGTALSWILPSRVDNVHCRVQPVDWCTCLSVVRLATTSPCISHNYSFADWEEQDLASRESVVMLMHFKTRVMLCLDQIHDASGNFMSALCCCILGCVLLRTEIMNWKDVPACDAWGYGLNV